MQNKIPLTKKELGAVSAISWLSGSLFSLPAWMMIICPEKVSAIMNYPTSNSDSFPLTGTIGLCIMAALVAFAVYYYCRRKINEANEFNHDVNIIDSDYTDIINPSAPAVELRHMAGEGSNWLQDEAKNLFSLSEEGMPHPIREGSPESQEGNSERENPYQNIFSFGS